MVSVVSNEIPREFTQLTQCALRGDFAGARELQRQYLPLMEVNFVESNPIPVKAAMALMGLLEPVWRLPLCPPNPANSARIEKVARSHWVCWPAGACMQAEIEKLFDQTPATYTDDHFHLFQRFKHALNAGQIRAAEPDQSTKTGWRVNAWVKKGILIGFRMGTVVDMSINATRQPWFDKATFPVQHLTADRGIRIVPGGSSIRDGCYIGKRRHVHAADVHQHRELGGRWHHDRFARAGGKLRASGIELPHFGRGADRRSAGTGGRAARDY